MKFSLSKVRAAVLIMFVMILSSGCAIAEKGQGAASAGLKPVGKLGPIPDDLFHVQGVSVGTDTVFISSVKKDSGEALLWKIDRKSMKTVAVRNYAESLMYHPSGFQNNGKTIWMAVAVYAKNTNSMVLRINPVTMKVEKKFKVKDHIGLMTSDGAGTLIGANWDARKFYVWNEDGDLLSTHDNPTGHGYQDCKLNGKRLLCNGGGFVDLIDTTEWKVLKSIEPGEAPGGNNLTREGMDFRDGLFYFMPDDGPGTFIYIYR